MNTILKVALVVLCILVCSNGIGPKRLKVATWNVGLFPWLSDTKIISKVSDVFHIFALEEVWSPATANRIIQKSLDDYPYSYYVPPSQGAPVQCIQNNANCALFNQTNDCGAAFSATFIQCLQDTGVNTSQFIATDLTPSSPCYNIGLFLAVVDPYCAACVQNEMHKLSVGNAFNAWGICNGPGGDPYDFGGSPGILVLSVSQITPIKVQYFDSYAVRRAVFFANIGGITFAISHFPFNVFEGFPLPPSPGALQPDLAQAIIAEHPDVVMGDLNSGFDYQPDGYNLLINDYTDVSEGVPTYCTEEIAADPRCVGWTPLAIDHIMLSKQKTWYYSVYEIFNAKEKLSDHVGLRSTTFVLGYDNDEDDE